MNKKDSSKHMNQWEWKNPMRDVYEENQLLKARNEELESTREFFEVYANNLENTVIEKNNEVEIYQESLNSIDDLKCDIISNVSHELKTPLTILQGALEQAIYEDDKEERNHFIEIAKKAIDRQHKVITDLITLAEFPQGMVNMKMDAADIGEIVGEAIKQRRDSFPEICINNNVAAIGQKVRIDRNKINQVVYNLLDNAIKFSEGKGEIEIGAIDRGKYMVMYIKDNGIGITPGDMKRIFKPLTQLDPSPRRKYGGLGVGLAISKRIIEAHDGAIWVESKPNEGSTFFISLPVLEAENE